MEAIDLIQINFKEDQLILLNWCLSFLMFGVALDIQLGDFRNLWKKPKITLVALSSQLILLPLLTLILVFYTATFTQFGGGHGVTWCMSGWQCE